MYVSCHVFLKSKHYVCICLTMCVCVLPCVFQVNTMCVCVLPCVFKVNTMCVCVLPCVFFQNPARKERRRHTVKISFSDPTPSLPEEERQPQEAVPHPLSIIVTVLRNVSVITVNKMC